MRIDGGNSLLNPTLARALTELRSTFDDLNRQLSTGKKSATYGGLGDARAISLAMRARLSETDGFRSTITEVGLRVDLVSTTLQRLSDLGAEQRADTNVTENTIIANGQTRAQIAAGTRFQEALSLLRTDINGRALFAGRATEAEPVLTAKTILDGEGTRMGLRGVIAERRAADAGTVDVDLAGSDSVGRVVIGAPGATDFTMIEDGAHPFGFKLAGGATTIPGATISTPTGTPPESITVSLSSQPAPGQTVRLSFNLPDGTRDEIVLTASANPGRDDEFAIGASLADSVQNLRDRVVGALDAKRRSSLSAASAMVAAESFFAAGPQVPPQRVSGPPATATALVDATPTDTVVWYTGDDDPASSARDTLSARIDRAVSVSYGVRANEEGIAASVRTLAVFAAEVYAPGDADQPSHYKALSERVRTSFAPSNGSDALSTLQVEMAGVKRSMKAISERHDVVAGVTQDLIDSTENADTEEVASKLLAVNTRLQATYQTTAMLSQLSLVKYL